MPGFVAPMQAMLVDSIRPGDWIYEIKFDGYRALALRGGNETRILSRNEKDLGGKFPEVKDAVAALDVQDAVIDGEIVALDDKGRSSFQLLQGFDMGLVRPPIVFYAFDLLRLNGKDLQNLPIEERKAKLEGLLKKPPGVIRYSVSFTKKIEELLSRAQELGLEGLIGKRSGSRYEAGKTHRSMGQNQALPRARIRDRRIYRAGRVAETLRRLARWLLRRQELQICRQSRNRVQRKASALAL